MEHGTVPDTGLEWFIIFLMQNLVFDESFLIFISCVVICHKYSSTFTFITKYIVGGVMKKKKFNEHKITFQAITF
jgi:hypothetical protein